MRTNQARIMGHPGAEQEYQFTKEMYCDALYSESKSLKGRPFHALIILKKKLFISIIGVLITDCGFFLQMLHSS